MRDRIALLPEQPDISRERTAYVAKYQENIVDHDTFLLAIAA